MFVWHSVVDVCRVTSLGVHTNLEGAKATTGIICHSRLVVLIHACCAVRYTNGTDFVFFIPSCEDLIGFPLEV